LRGKLPSITLMILNGTFLQSFVSFQAKNTHE
jgi:hypothetical protein